jgi:DNA gyrase subunit A
MEVADDPCTVLLSATGLIARTPAEAERQGRGGPGTDGGAGSRDRPGAAERAAHDAIASAAAATARGHVGVVTSAGRVIRLGVLEIPALPPTAHPAGLAGGAPLSEFISLSGEEKAVALCSLGPDGPPLALGTAEGVVKRVTPDYPQARDDFEVISLRDGDRVVGAAPSASDDADLVFITSDAQLLRFKASTVRPQGRAAGGMAGIRLAPAARVIWFGTVTAADAADPGAAGGDCVVVTVAGAAGTLPGTGAGGVKVTPYAQFPAKGRGTGGVRCHRFLHGEDELLLAWAGASPALGATAAGTPVDLPGPFGKRDGSGIGLTHPLAMIGGAFTGGS